MRRSVETSPALPFFIKDWEGTVIHLWLTKSYGYVLLSFLTAFAVAASLWFFLPDYFFSREGMLLFTPVRAKSAIAISAFIVILWVLRPIPTLITSLLPILLLAVLDVQTISTTLSSYSSHFVVTAGCGFILATPLHRWRLDQRAALSIFFLFGPSKVHIVRGVYALSAFLSMWLPSAPLAILLCPILLSMASYWQKFGSALGHRDVEVAQMLLFLSAASGITIGSFCMLIGSQVSLALSDYLFHAYHARIGHLVWFALGLPVFLLGSVFTCFLLTHVIGRSILQAPQIPDRTVLSEMRRLGRMKREEHLTLLILSVTLFLWASCNILRASFVPLINPNILNITSVSVAAALLFFLIPAGKDKKEFLANTRDLYLCPWWVLFFIGASVAMADSLRVTGAVNYVTSLLVPLIAGEHLAGLVALCLIAWCASNFCPQLGSGALVPAFFMALFGHFTNYNEDLSLSVALCASVTFLLPISSVSNLVMFNSGYIPVKEFVRFGLLLSAFTVPILIATPVAVDSLIEVSKTEISIDGAEETATPESSLEAVQAKKKSGPNLVVPLNEILADEKASPISPIRSLPSEPSHQD